MVQTPEFEVDVPLALPVLHGEIHEATWSALEADVVS
jgi:hypothetical protein